MIQAKVISVNPVEIFRPSQVANTMPHDMKGLSWPATTSWTALLYPGAVSWLHRVEPLPRAQVDALAQHRVLLTLTVPRMESMPFSSHADVRARCRYVSYVVREIDLYRPLLAGRVAGMHWVADLVRLLCPLELTKLMYSLNRKLGVSAEGPAARSVELGGPPPEDGVLPLLSGLGFTDLCFNFVDGEHWAHATLQQCISLAGSLGFERLHFRVESVRDLDALLRLCMPASVFVESDLEACRSLLGGFRETVPGFFVRSSGLPEVDALCGLGLGGISAAAEGFWQNTVRLDHYYEALDSGRLPLSGHGGKNLPIER